MKDLDLNSYFKEVNERYEAKTKEILNTVKSAESKIRELLTRRSTFIICGASGSGKTLSIDRANEKLDTREQIAESQAILFCKSIDEAIDIIMNDDSCYEDCRYIAYSITNQELGEMLSKNIFCPVIFMNK